MSSTMEWQALKDDSEASDMISYNNNEYLKSLLSGLNDLRGKAAFCDVILRVGGTTFPAHKCVLATVSPYFNAMFTSDFRESHNREVTLKDIEPAILESLLDFFYTGTIGITKANVQSLMTVSNFLQVRWVRDACSLFMAKDMDASNCLGIQCFAETTNCEKLQEMAKEFAIKNFLDVVDHEEFLNLPFAKIVELVSSDTLDMPREEDVFTAVLKWFNHQPEARRDDFHKVLECVRLPLMSPDFLHDSVSKQEVVRTSLECHILLEEALMYHLLPNRRGDMQSARTWPRRSNTPVDVIVCAGVRGGEGKVQRLEAFDPVSNQWVSLSDLPFAVIEHGVVVTEQNMMYVAGGNIGNSRSNRLLKFDPQINEWEEMASMSRARSRLGMAVLDGFLYAVGGYDGSDTLALVERYNIETNKWEQLPALRTATSNATVLAHGGYVYVAGGQKRVVDGRYYVMKNHGTMQRFDPRTREWANVAQMLTPQSGAAGCALDGKLYVIGGSKDDGATNEVECYDVRTNKWEYHYSMRAKRVCPGAAVMGGHIYVLGGQDDRQTPLCSVERFTPATFRWEDVFQMTMTSPRHPLACVTLKVRKSLLSSGNE